MDRVLVATDFSIEGNTAVAHAYRLVEGEGTVHLVHVIKIREPRATPNPLYAHYAPGKVPTPSEREAEHREVRRQLEFLLPPVDERRGVKSEMHVLESRRDCVGRAILGLANCLDVSIICVGAHRNSLRARIVRLLGGSVTRTLFQRGSGSLLVVRPERYTEKPDP